VTGQRGGQQLSPYFVEWMMGWPDGWATGVPGLSRNDMIRVMGNGIVPQQASVAVHHLWAYYRSLIDGADAHL
jgi:DNA (cytosine-5)-methyltransferase 1